MPPSSHLSFVDFNPPAAPLVIFVVGSLGRKHSTWSNQNPQSTVAWSCNGYYTIINNTTLMTPYLVILILTFIKAP